MFRLKVTNVVELSQSLSQVTISDTLVSLNFKLISFLLFFDQDSFGGINGKSSHEEVVTFPNNLTLRDLYYFMAVPSLCYELNFPRTSRIRKRFLLKRAIEVFLGMQVVLGLFQQWIIPSVKNSLDTFSVSPQFRLKY